MPGQRPAGSAPHRTDTVAFLSANSVQGKDLLLFTADDLVADLRMTRFGARKALVLRDAFLRG